MRSLAVTASSATSMQGSYFPRVRMSQLVLATTLLASPALAQGPDCSSATAIAGNGVHAFDLTGRQPAGPVGGGTCVEDTGASYGDVFWQWTCTTAGDYLFEIDASHATSLILYEGLIKRVHPTFNFQAEAKRFLLPLVGPLPMSHFQVLPDLLRRSGGHPGRVFLQHHKLRIDTAFFI